MAVVLYGILGVVGGLECWSGDMALLFVRVRRET